MLDIYYCKPNDNLLDDAVIARYGNDLPDYAASLPPESFADKAFAFKNEWYRYAIRQAIDHCLYSDPNGYAKKYLKEYDVSSSSK